MPIKATKASGAAAAGKKRPAKTSSVAEQATVARKPATARRSVNASPEIDYSDVIRERIRARIAALGLDMKEVNDALGLGATSTWTNDYLGSKKSPKLPPARLVPKLSEVLQLPSAALQPPDQPSGQRYIPVIPNRSVTAHPIDWSKVDEWLQLSPRDSGASANFAWRTDSDVGPLTKGRLVLAMLPVGLKVGDAVVVVQNGRVLLDGVLVHSAQQGHFSVETGKGPPVALDPAANLTIYKVLAVRDR